MSDEMAKEEASQELFRKGLEWLKKKDPVNAVFCFEEMVKISNRSPMSLSCLGLAMARAKVDIARAEKLCMEAVKKAPASADFYRSLAEVYLAAGKKAKAIWALKKGLRVDGKKGSIAKELKKFGIRKRPPIPFLSRSNPLNKYIGMAASRIKADKG
ncbi:MAG: hypothetical protein RQ824_10440 [bacterium]|nr:hypothetical protein [bacterium]